jgi:hypothetical protein
MTSTTVNFGAVSLKFQIIIEKGKRATQVLRLSGSLGLTPDLRLSDMGAPKRTLVDGIEGRLTGNPIDQQRTR